MWPFSRKKCSAAPPAPPLIAERWQVGDVAECVRDDWALSAGGRAPRRGSRYIVTRVKHHPFTRVGRHPVTFIALTGYPAEDLWLGYGFRKIVLSGVHAEDDAGEKLPARELIDG